MHPKKLTTAVAGVLCEELRTNGKGYVMDHALSTAAAYRRKSGQTLLSDGFRLIHEDPPTNNGEYFRYGVQEACLQRYQRIVPIEAELIHEYAGGSFGDVMTGFFKRTDRLTRSITDVCAYWMTSTVSVERRDSDDTEVPVMTCCVLAPKRYIAFTFDPLDDNVDDDAEERLASLRMSAERICPSLQASPRDTAAATTLAKTIRNGLGAGLRLTDTKVWYPYRGGN